MTDYAPPSGDPANEDSMAGLFRTQFAKLLQNVDDCLPARVIAVTVENGKRWATVHPLVMVGTTDGRKVSRAQIARVPVFQMGGGDFVISFPLKPGDFGWIKATDRDISLFLQALEEEWPNTTRRHSFQDGVFLPDVMREWALAPADAERLVLQSTDGATRIALGADTIEIETSGAAKITADSVEITATTVAVDSGATTVSGPVTFSGLATFSGGVEIDGTPFEDHHHGGVTTGGGISGGVVP